MRDKFIQKIEYVEYYVDAIFWAFISMIWYKRLLFRCLFNLTYTESKLVLWGIILGSVVFLRIFIYKTQNTWTLISSLLLPYGIYTVMTYSNTVSGRIKLSLIFAAGMSLLTSILVMTRKIPNEKRRKRIMKRRAHKCLINTVNITSIAMVVIMLPMLFGGVFGNSLFKSNTKAKSGVSLEKQSLSGNMEMVLKLQQDEWVNLSTKEKIDVMQTVANIEARYLGIPNEINVGVANLREYTLACYSDQIHTIYIDLEHIEKDRAEDVLNSCCHEVFHCYQYRLIDAFNNTGDNLKELRIFKGVTDYIDEFETYADGYQDFCAYYFQQCEMDAREYGESAVEDYYARIEAYLESY